MKIVNTGDPQVKPSVVMMVYGEGGVGKSTFASTAPKPLLADCENGAKYFGLRGIKIDVAQIEKWGDIGELIQVIKTSAYETVVIDPVGELMEKLKRYMIAKGEKKLVQNDGSPSMAGWGWLKKTMRDFIKILRDTGKHVIIVAHVEEKADEERLVKRPKVETKLSSELVNIVDIVAYMTTISDGNEDKRVLYIDPTSDKFVAKDRTGQLGKILPPNFNKIVNGIHGNENYKWCKKLETKVEKTKEVAKPAEQSANAKKMQEARDKVMKANNKSK